MNDNVDVSNLTSSQRAEVEEKITKSIAQAQAVEMIQAVNNRCVKKCIDYPGTSLSSSQQVSLPFPSLIP